VKPRSLTGTRNPADSTSFVVQGALRGAAGTRTPDLRRARAALSQLSYGPQHRRGRFLSPSTPVSRVGAPGLEPGTSALSGPRSNQLSYAPAPRVAVPAPWSPSRRGRRGRRRRSLPVMHTRHASVAGITPAPCRPVPKTKQNPRTQAGRAGQSHSLSRAPRAIPDPSPCANARLPVDPGAPAGPRTPYASTASRGSVPTTNGSTPRRLTVGPRERPSP